MGIFSKRRKPQDDEKFLEALNFVMSGSKAKEIQWISLGVAGYMHWIKNTGTLSPDRDFEFIKIYVPQFWDTYRSAAMSAANAPRLSTTEVVEVLTQMQLIVDGFPEEYQGQPQEVKELLIYMCSSITALEESGNIELSNSLIHAVSCGHIPE